MGTLSARWPRVSRMLAALPALIIQRVYNFWSRPSLWSASIQPSIARGTVMFRGFRLPLIGRRSCRFGFAPVSRRCAGHGSAGLCANEMHSTWLAILALVAIVSAPAVGLAQSATQASPNADQHYGEIADPSVWPISAVGTVNTILNFQSREFCTGTLSRTQIGTHSRALPISSNTRQCPLFCWARTRRARRTRSRRTDCHLTELPSR